MITVLTGSDLPAMAGISYQADPEENVVTLSITREEVEPEPEVVEAEPEVVAAKGKKDEDEE